MVFILCFMTGMAQPFFQFMDLFAARVAVEEEEAATVLIGAKVCVL